MKTKRWGRLSAEFKKQAVEKMKKSANVSALAVELGVPRRQLYRWQEKQEQAGLATTDKPDNADDELNRLRRENEQLALSLAKRQLEVDFFRGALC